jgi:hypothetical protein
MNAPTLLVAAIGAVVLIGGISAVGAAAPAPAEAGNATADAAGADTADAGAEETDDEDASAEDDAVAEEHGPVAVGPAGGLPDQVPDRVSEIHATIEAFGNGTVDSLGDALSGLLSADGDASKAGDSGANAGGAAAADAAT